MNHELMISKSITRPGKYAVKARAYFFPAGESIIDNLMNRRTRPAALYRSLLPQALQRTGMSGEDAAFAAANAVWSQKAGCRCGCSPGFILSTVHGLDFFVEVVVVREPAIMGGV